MKDSGRGGGGEAAGRLRWNNLSAGRAMAARGSRSCMISDHDDDADCMAH